MILETSRLRLRELNLEDSEFIIELLNTPGWLQFIGDKNVRTKDQAINYLEKGPLKSYYENGFGLSLVEKKADGVSIGTCGILKRDTLDKPDLGFAFLPEYTGMGYAYEVAKALLEYTYHELKQPEIYAITKTENHSSIKLLIKLNFEFEKMVNLNADAEELKLFKINLESLL
ncbi:MAG: GNAT family N-acetyltransferase [Saprospiraceae bacterium]|nr:GNAT family N-acetyltransferase [Saprospiraceae bacterium]